jgi:hypothetical protein
VSRRGLISDVKAELCRQLGLRSKEGLYLSQLQKRLFLDLLKDPWSVVRIKDPVSAGDDDGGIVG